MIIDANVFKGYFQAEMDKPHSLCGCPKKLFERATPSNPIFHDKGSIMEQEWRDVVSNEWFEGWLAGALAADIISFASADINLTIEKKVKSKGFPVGRDVVYIRVALSVSSKKGACDFFTEDIDFFDPKKKNCNSKTRRQILQKSSGPVAKLLTKSNVFISCVP